MTAIKVSLQDILNAHKRIEKHIHKTPVLKSRLINQMANTSIFFKCENMQKCGAFKYRGASNAVLLENGDLFCTHSSGNHGAALAYAAQSHGKKAIVVMPETAPEIKKKAVKAYGAEVVFCKPSQISRENTLKKIKEENGAVEIHGYDNWNIIAGQGTATLELINELKNPDLIMAPLGGGGLTSGTAIAAKSLSKEIKIIGVEPDMADDALRSIQTGKIVPSDYPDTIADGLRTSLSDKTFAVISQYVDDILTVSENSIIEAMRIIWDRMKIIVEPSAAVGLAAVLEHNLGVRFRKIGIILSGGNVDLTNLPWSRT